MEKNVCGVDRLARAVLGGFLLAVLLRSGREPTDGRAIGIRDLLLSYAIAELSVNVFAQWCPLNALFGVDTCQRS